MVGDPFEVVAMAASAGGLGALTQILSVLPADFGAAILVVQHLDPRHRSLMAEMLSRRCSLTVTEAREGDLLDPGNVIVAPPNRHLLANPTRTVSLSESELVHFLRPSADLLFESVAASYRDRSIAVILSGTGIDGTMGAKAIKVMGGTVIAQDEASSEFFGMPRSAIEAGTVDFVLALDEIGPTLVRLVEGEAP